jgi:hypothetical protein
MTSPVSVAPRLCEGDHRGIDPMRSNVPNRASRRRPSVHPMQFNGLLRVPFFIQIKSRLRSSHDATLERSPEGPLDLATSTIARELDLLAIVYSSSLSRSRAAIEIVRDTLATRMIYLVMTCTRTPNLCTWDDCHREHPDNAW